MRALLVAACTLAILPLAAQQPPRQTQEDDHTKRGKQARTAAHPAADPETEYIEAHLAKPIPQGGEARLLIDKTYGASSIPSQISKDADGRQRLYFENPRPDKIQVLIRARRVR